MDLSENKFPFPQLHLGSLIFALYEDSIELLDGDFNVIASIVTKAGGTWHIADFGAFFVFANGSQVLTYDPSNGFTSAPNMPLFQTCCAFNGQLFVGAFTSPPDEDDPYYDDPYTDPYS